MDPIGAFEIGLIVGGVVVFAILVATEFFGARR